MQSYIFQEGSLTPKESHESVLVADSFLVEDGKVRSYHLHLDRFIRGLKDKAPELLQDLEPFLDQALALIPRTGRYFPRYEVQEGPVFVFMLREAPEQLGPANLWTYPYPDPRKDLSTKGPELSLGVELRSLAQAQGADETILLNEHGEISEGALSSLVWAARVQPISVSCITGRKVWFIPENVAGNWNRLRSALCCRVCAGG